MVGVLLDNDLSGMLDLLDSALQRSGWAIATSKILISRANYTRRKHPFFPSRHYYQ